MIELQTSVKQDDTTHTRTPKPGYLNLSNIVVVCDINCLANRRVSDMSNRFVRCLTGRLQRTQVTSVNTI